MFMFDMNTPFALEQVVFNQVTRSKHSRELRVMSTFNAGEPG